MATRKPPGDPRVAPPETGEESVKPVVPLPRAGPSPLVFGIGAVVAAVLLFSVLDARRRSLSAPSTRERAADQLAVAAPPPPLFVPREIPGGRRRERAAARVEHGEQQQAGDASRRSRSPSPAGRRAAAPRPA